ncbi:hypothetical protein D3C84_1095000 [compost metagenome]
MSGYPLVEVTAREERLGTRIAQTFHTGELKRRKVCRFIDQHLTLELVGNPGQLKELRLI